MTQAPPELTEEQQKELQEKLKNMTPEEIAQLQKQQCIFCQIIAGKIPSKKIYEDDLSIAVLDINPAAKGHILLLPKEHYAIMPQVPEKLLHSLFITSRTLSQLLLKALRASGTNIFVANGLAAGQKAQHFMIHIIPRKEGDKILDVENKLIDKELQHKVKVAIENKLYELLGVKKKVVSVQQTLEKEDTTSEENNEVIPKNDTKKEGDLEELAGKNDDNDEESEKENNNESSNEEPEETNKNSAEEDDEEENSEKETDDAEESEDADERASDDKQEDNNEENENKGGADLDAIANMFK